MPRRAVYDFARNHVPLLLLGCAAAALISTVLLLAVDAHLSGRAGLRRTVYAQTAFRGAPLVRDVSASITLDFLDDDPVLPRTFFSARWRGYWHVAEAQVFDLWGGADDRLEVRIDGRLVLRRAPPADTSATVRTVVLDAGIHEIVVDYEQHGGDHHLSLAAVPRGGRGSAFARHRLFRSRPSPTDIRLARAAVWLESFVFIAWAMLLLAVAAPLARRLWTSRTDSALYGKVCRFAPGVLLVTALLVGTLHNLHFVQRHAEGTSCCNLGIDTATYDRIAADAARSGRLVVPIDQPPGFVAFLAVLYGVFGHDYLPPKIAFCLMVSGIAAGIWWLGRRYAGEYEGMIAGGLVLLSPMFQAYAVTLQYEVLVAFLFLATCLLLFGARDASGRWAGVLYMGAACGAAACALTRETFAAVFPLMLVAAYRWSPDRRRAFTMVAAMATLFSILIAAWMVEQQRSHGRFVPISSKGPLNLHIGNNPNASGTFNLHLTGIGEPRGWPFVRDSSGAALALAGRKLLYFSGIEKDGWHVPGAAPIWLSRLLLDGVSLDRLQTLSRSAIPLLGLAGLCIMLRRPALRRTLWILPATVGTLMGTHAVFISSYRFALPVLPYIFLLAAIALVRVARELAPLLRRRACMATIVAIVWMAIVAFTQSPGTLFRIQAVELEASPTTVVRDPFAGNGTVLFRGQTGERRLLGMLSSERFPAGFFVAHFLARSNGPARQDILELSVTGYDGGVTCHRRIAWTGNQRGYRRLSASCPYLPRQINRVEVWSLGTADIWLDDVSIEFGLKNVLEAP